MRLNQQLASGLFFLGFGGLAFWLATALPMGTAADMGVGYTPRMLAVGCLAVGVIRIASIFFGSEASEPVSIAFGPLALVTVMVAGFALLLPWLGLPLAVIVSVLPAAISGETFRWHLLLAIAVVLAALTTVLFAYGLKLQIPVWPTVPGLAVLRL